MEESWPKSLASSPAIDSVDKRVPYRSKAMMVFLDAMVVLLLSWESPVESLGAGR